MKTGVYFYAFVNMGSFWKARIITSLKLKLNKSLHKVFIFLQFLMCALAKLCVYKLLGICVLIGICNCVCTQSYAQIIVRNFDCRSCL